MRPLFTVLSFVILLSASPSHAAREFSLDLWDWTTPCSDLPTFKRWAADLKSIGITRIEISAPWAQMEPTPGKYNLSYIADRLAIAKSLGMGLRVRISSFYSGATPSWYHGAHQLDKDGKPPLGGWIIPSVNDPQLWQTYGKMCTAIAARFKGEDIFFNPFIGMHAELKWSDWWDYDPASLKLWKDAIHASPRPDWLARVVADAPLPDIPPIAGPTHGTPDQNPATLAHIAFREYTYRQALKHFVDVIHAGDPDARISVPLGESFRTQSAEIANQDYWGLSRGASQVVHSYDFFWHHDDPAWYAAAAVASFRGITGKPIVFEFDGPFLTEQLHYTPASLDDIAKAALAQGAGIKAANYSGSPKLPHEWPVLVDFGKLCAAAPQYHLPPSDKTILLFVSKWANYAYREPTQWLHDAQFGAWKMLTDAGLPVRIICEDNLSEDLSSYRGLYIAFSPPALMPHEDQQHLATLSNTLPTIIELRSIPSTEALTAALPNPAQPSGRSITLDCPLAYHWLHDKDHAAAQSLLMQSLTTLHLAP